MCRPTTTARRPSVAATDRCHGGVAVPSRCREPSRPALAEPRRISVVLPPYVGRLRLLVMVKTAFLTVTALASVVDASLLSTSAFVLAPFGGAKQGRQVLTTLGLASVVLLAYAVIVATAIVVVLVAMQRLVSEHGQRPGPRWAVGTVVQANGRQRLLAPAVPPSRSSRSHQTVIEAVLGAKQPTGLFCTLPGKTARWVGRRAVRRGPRKLRRPVVAMMVLASRSRAKGRRLMRCSPPVGPGTRGRRDRRVQGAPHLVQEHRAHPKVETVAPSRAPAAVDAASFSSGTASCTRSSGGRRSLRCPTVR